VVRHRKTGPVLEMFLSPKGIEPGKERQRSFDSIGTSLIIVEGFLDQMGDTPKHSIPARASKYHPKHRFMLLWCVRNSPHISDVIPVELADGCRTVGVGFKPAPKPASA
jgi:hypothetical protein